MSRNRPIKPDIVIALILLGLGSALYSQEAVQNYGNVKLHSTGQLGFHSDLINDARFENEDNLVGFYSQTSPITISGNYIPILHDAEFDAKPGLILDVPVEVINNGNLISGDIQTSREISVQFLSFTNDSFYTGESSVSKIDGYGAVRNKQDFTFPVGDASRIRPLSITSMAIQPQVKCAYFPEDPNSPKSLNSSFETSKTSDGHLRVSDKEFWRLEGGIPAKVTLSWDVYSNVAGLAEFLTELKVVGWSKTTRQWVNLGNTEVSGGRDYGTITSDYFVADEYEILTIGGNDDTLAQYKTFELDNYYLSPNGDGNNETLVIEPVLDAPNNTLQIYNRYGLLVYKKDRYNNDFDGKSNSDLSVNKDAGLEDGIYFYIITFHDLQERHQGYFYLTN
ncbi:gliding motility-associated C-terminal domain-containing protein [Robiginitalea sp. IMCC43444]|uniref:gliding motility-associated C-terminal domain-containing protein n=1 Tax=Robiginitalea sp. IMCC43444 TaxID=3459121 RepID=UPI004042E789